MKIRVWLLSNSFTTAFCFATLSMALPGLCQAPPKLPIKPAQSDALAPPPAGEANSLENKPKSLDPSPTVYPPELTLEVGASMGAIQSLAFSSNGEEIAVAADRLVRVYRSRGGELLTTIRGDRSRESYGSINCVAYSPDGKHLVVGITDTSPRGAIRVYSTSEYGKPKLLSPVVTSPVRKIAFSHDGLFIAITDTNGKTIVADWSSVLAGSHRVLSTFTARGNDSRIVDQTEFSEDNRILLAIESSGPQIYDVRSARNLENPNEFSPKLSAWIQGIFGGAYKDPFGNKIEPRIIDFDFAGSHWATAGVSKANGRDNHWAGLYGRSKSPSQATYYRDHRWQITAVAVSRDGRIAASGDKLGEIHVWDSHTGKAVGKIVCRGSPIYNADYDSNNQKIGFTRTPDTATWRVNSYGKIDQVLDLTTRAITPIYPEQPFEGFSESLQIDDSTLAHRKIPNSERSELILQKRDGTINNRCTIHSGIVLSAYTTLPSSASGLMGTKLPVLYGDTEGRIVCWGADTNEIRRGFRGHEDMVTSISIAGSGKFFVTGSTDRTIRIWPTGEYNPCGLFDFEFEDETVYRVLPDSSAERAGVRSGDRVISINGLLMFDFYERLLQGRPPTKPGETAEVVIDRGTERKTIQLTMRQGFDYVEPLLSLFVSEEGQWVLWTPEGFYDCSPGADKLIGWHVNRGPYEAAEFFYASQFRETMYRPDIIQSILDQGSFVRESLSQNISHSIPNLKKPGELKRLQPPAVTWISPKANTASETKRVELEAVIEAKGDLPITRVTLLASGIPTEVLEPKDQAEARHMTVKSRVTLQPGKNHFAWLAENGVSQNSPSSNQIVITSDGKRARHNAAALIVGVSDYQNRDENITPLRYAANDAKAFEGLLAKQRNGKVYDQIQTKVLTDQQATRQSILSSLKQLERETKDNDVVVLFFSMHGFIDDKNRFYLASHDSLHQDLFSTAIPWSSILEFLHRDLSGRHRFVFIDACRAGEISKVAKNPFHELTDDRYGAIFFASCGPHQESIEKEQWQHGAFTKSVLDLVDDQKADIEPQTGDGLLNKSEMEIYIRPRVMQMTRGQQAPLIFSNPYLDDLKLFEAATVAAKNH